MEQAKWMPYDLTTFAQPVDSISEWTVHLVANGDAERVPNRIFEAPLLWRNCVRA